MIRYDGDSNVNNDSSIPTNVSKLVATEVPIATFFHVADSGVDGVGVYDAVD
jgi:hypothetical protein